MTSRVYLGTCPVMEPCVQTTDPEYGVKAYAECERWIALLRRTFGREPKGARLQVVEKSHDYGQYLEVVCSYDPQDDADLEYALRCVEERPERWGDEG